MAEQYSSFNSQGAPIDVSLFVDSTTKGIAQGNAVPNTFGAIAEGITEGVNNYTKTSGAIANTQQTQAQTQHTKNDNVVTGDPAYQKGRVDEQAGKGAQAQAEANVSGIEAQRKIDAANVAAQTTAQKLQNLKTGAELGKLLGDQLGGAITGTSAIPAVTAATPGTAAAGTSVPGAPAAGGGSGLVDFVSRNGAFFSNPDNSKQGFDAIAALKRQNAPADVIQNLQQLVTGGINEAKSNDQAQAHLASVAAHNQKNTDNIDAARTIIQTKAGDELTKAFQGTKDSNGNTVPFNAKSFDVLRMQDYQRTPAGTILFKDGKPVHQDNPPTGPSNYAMIANGRQYDILDQHTGAELQKHVTAFQQGGLPFTPETSSDAGTGPQGSPTPDTGQGLASNIYKTTQASQEINQSSMDAVEARQAEISAKVRKQGAGVSYLAAMQAGSDRVAPKLDNIATIPQSAPAPAGQLVVSKPIPDATPTVAAEGAQGAVTKQDTSSHYNYSDLSTRIGQSLGYPVSLNLPTGVKVSKAVIDRVNALPGIGNYAAVVKAIIAKESSGNPNAVGPVTHSGEQAAGLGQFMPATAKDMGITDRLDPAQSEAGTARYIQALYTDTNNRLIRASGQSGIPVVPDIRFALSAYNGGLEDIYAGIDKGIKTWSEMEPFIRSRKSVANADENINYVHGTTANMLAFIKGGNYSDDIGLQGLLADGVIRRA